MSLSDVQEDAGTTRNAGEKNTVSEVFERFKDYLDTRLEEFSNSNLVQTTSSPLGPNSETKKLQREAESQKLKKKGNSKQLLFNAS